jgi:large subunit ribosomal protein L24
MNRIRSNDTVIVTTGKSKGHVGKARIKGNSVIVEGANMVKKHVRENPQLNQEGGIISKEAPLDISNVAIYNPNTKKADKVGFRFLEKDGNTIKVRFFKSDNELIDIV